MGFLGDAEIFFELILGGFKLKNWSKMGKNRQKSPKIVIFRCFLRLNGFLGRIMGKLEF